MPEVAAASALEEPKAEKVTLETTASGWAIQAPLGPALPPPVKTAASPVAGPATRTGRFRTKAGLPEATV